MGELLLHTDLGRNHLIIILKAILSTFRALSFLDSAAQIIVYRFQLSGHLLDSGCPSPLNPGFWSLNWLPSQPLVIGSIL